MPRKSIQDYTDRVVSRRFQLTLLRHRVLSNEEVVYPCKQAAGFHGVVNIGLASSSSDAASGCSAFQRMAAVIRVRPLG